MDKVDISKIIHLIFKYLTAQDLSIAAQVSKSWKTVAIRECMDRNCYYYLVDRLKIRNFSQLIHGNWYIQKYFNNLPSLDFKFSNVYTDVKILHGYYCRNKSYYWLKVNIKSNFPQLIKEKENSSLSLDFPIFEDAEATVLSFINRNNVYKDFRGIIDYQTNKFNCTENVAAEIKNFLKEEYYPSSILIIFCTHTSYNKLFEAWDVLRERFQYHNLSFWVAVVDELSICRYSYENYDCKIDTEFLFMFINNSLMKAYVDYISNECKDGNQIREELNAFKMRVQLSVYSIALIHVPYVHMEECYELVISLFEEIFPTVYLFPIYGSTSFGGSCILEWIRKNKRVTQHFKHIFSLGIDFTNVETDEDLSHKPFCNNKRFCYFIVNIKSNFNKVNVKEKDSFLRLNFPFHDTSDVTILSFVNRCTTDKTTCSKIRHHSAKIEAAKDVVNSLKSFLEQDYYLSSILIIFCTHTSYNKFFEVCDILKDRFRYHEMTFWVAVVDELSICKHKYGNYDCKVDTEFLFMFINNSLMRAYVDYIPNECKNDNQIRAEFNDFKNRVELSIYSTAFMHVPYTHMEKYYELVTSIFREVFPHVYLFPFYGSASFGGSCIFETIMNLATTDVSSYLEKGNKFITILILSKP
ncbi:hypothetical protein M0802_005841 [Mischocyttarus mexicanus]|nr:hypothetical protein M0802_005841 [Mischocyttarus mexicanus]